jgi:hypothetical protein
MKIELFEPIRVEDAWTRKTLVTRSSSNFTNGVSKSFGYTERATA